VTISAYGVLIRDDAVLELLDVMAAIVTSLEENTLGSYVREVSVGEETPIQALVNQEAIVLRKTIQIQYTREE
jgi:hypothetical protein